jgi:DNA-binding transcriptional MerR regulator
MRIGDVAALTDTPTSTIRFYERESLIPEPDRTSGGYREYTPDTVDRLRFIRRSQDAGLALADIRDVLAIRDSGQAPCEHVQDLLAERLVKVEKQMQDLAGLAQHLRELLDRAQSGSVQQVDASVCWILEDES